MYEKIKWNIKEITLDGIIWTIIIILIINWIVLKYTWFSLANNYLFIFFKQNFLYLIYILIIYILYILFVKIKKLKSENDLEIIKWEFVDVWCKELYRKKWNIYFEYILYFDTKQYWEIEIKTQNYLGNSSSDALDYLKTIWIKQWKIVYIYFDVNNADKAYFVDNNFNRNVIFRWSILPLPYLKKVYSLFWNTYYVKWLLMFI